MNQNIFIIGGGQTTFGEHWGKSLKDLMEEAVEKALNNSSGNVLDIDLVIISNMLAEQCGRQAHLGAIASAFFPHKPPAFRVEAACGSGAAALHTACGLLESGRYKNILVVGAEKMTDASNEEIASALMGAADAEKDAKSGLTFPGIFALIARRYMYEYGLSRSDLNYVSAYHHEQAMNNPYAQFHRPIKPENVSDSPLVADPLHVLDCSPISDGAAAVLLSTDAESEVSVAASQLAADNVSITERETITSFLASREAANRAYEEAGIKPSNLNYIELHDCFSIAAVISLEDLGLATPGGGVEYFKRPSNTFSVNLSGGLKACGHPVGATGIKQILDVSRQLKTNDKEWGLAQNFGGACATCGVHILHHHTESEV